MPDVGVLNLTIRDNSGDAASGLTRLAEALSAVKTAKQSFNLSNVGQQVINLAKTIQDTKGASSIISKLGTMFNAINKFSQIKSFTINADQLRDTAMYMNKAADGIDRINESRKATVTGGGAHDLYGQMVEEANTVKNVLEQTADSVQRSAGKIFNLQLFGGKKAELVAPAGMTELKNQTDGLVEAQSKIETLKNTASTSMEQIKSATDNATNAQIKLNEAGEAYAGKISIFDEAEKAYKQIYVDTSVMGEALKKAIDLSQVPASGRNGVFANVAEEVAYLKQKIDEEIASQQQWLSINEAATKQLKHGGGSKPKAELEFDKKYSEEGYYASLEAAEKYKSALVELSGYMNEYIVSSQRAAEENIAHAESMKKVTEATTEANQAMKNAVPSIETGKQEPVVQTPQRTPWTSDDVSNVVKYYSQVELLEMKYNDLLNTTAREIEENRLSMAQIMDKAIALQNLRGKIDALKEEQEKATVSSKSLRDAIEELFSTSKKGGLSKLISQFARMAKMRVIRYIIRSIAQGFREGIQNVYEYSKAIGSSFAPSMDSAASSLLQMKNSIGAAVAPAIQALIPVMQTVVNWFITGVNYVNQFFSLLNGQKTWTRALPQSAEAFKKQEKAAKGASAALKDLLADWDELNIIQSQNTGGGSGSGAQAAEDYLNMFEEVSRYDKKVKDIVGWVKDNFKTIKDVAIAIGAAMLAWKVAGAVFDVLKLVNTLKGGVIMSVVGFTLSSMAGASLADSGWSVETVLKTIGGLAASALGGSWVGAAAAKALGLTASAGAIVGAIAGLAIGIGFMIHSFHVKTIENAYGTIEEDANTIKNNVMKYFNPEAEALVRVSNARIADIGDAKQRVGDALAKLNDDYPVAVSVHTKESLENLKLDVDNLVLESKNLILKRKQNTRSLILNSEQFEDSDSFIKFSDKQWDATETYIEGLGKKLGELISRGITNGAELDGLREKLTKIVQAATYGQRAGEFAGKASIAGANLRNAGYTKDTVKSYIDTFLETRNEYENQALADALAQQAELSALVATLEERLAQGDTTVTEDDVEYARTKYKEFDVNKEKERLMGLYLGEGDKIFASDLFEGLSTVMENTKGDWKVSSMRKNLGDFSKNLLGLNADDYANSLYSYMLSTISEATGQDKESLQKLFEISGIDPLSLFDKQYADEIRENIANVLSSGAFTPEEQKRIAETYGIDDAYYDELANRTREKIQEAIEKAASAPGADDVTVGAEIGNLYATYGEEAVNDAINGMDIDLPDLEYDIEVPNQTVQVPPPDMSSFNNSLDESRNHILDWLEAYYMLTGIRGDTSGMHDKFESRVSNKFLRHYASGGFVKSGDLVMANENGNFEMMGRMGNQPVVANNQQIVAGITSGVSQANEGVESRLTVIEGLLTRILSKEFVAKAVPSASWGNFNNRSNNEYGKVTGV